MPQEYQLASEVWENILTKVKDGLCLETRNQTYTTIQSVLLVFRRRLRPAQILQFADVLPVTVRAIFVQGWTEEEFEPRFGTPSQLVQEVQSIRQSHNFSLDNSISVVTSAIRDCIDENELEMVLRSISDEALSYWTS